MGEFKLGSHLAQGDVESVEVETVERRSRGGGAKALQMQRGERGNQTLYQTDKAIYLASQLSSMQLLSAK